MRSLSGYEGCIVARTNHKIYYSFTVAATYKTRLSKQKILESLTIICNRFPQFSLHVDVSDNSISYLPTYDLSKIDGLIDIYQNEALDNVIAKYNDERTFQFNEMKPLWKVVLLTDKNTLLFVVDHTFFDGTAAKNFHYQFADALQKSSPSVFIIDTSNFDEYPDPTVLMGFGKGLKIPAVVVSSLQPELPTVLPTFDNNLSDLPMPSHNSNFFHISAKDSSKLIDMARSNDTKLTALMYAIATKCLISLPTMYTEEKTLFKTMIPINTRSHVKSLPQDSDILQFGMFFGKYFHGDDPKYLTEKSLVDISQNFQSKLTENMPKAMDDYEIFEEKASSDFSLVDQSMKDLFDRNMSPKTTLVMSNLGILNSTEIQQCYFDQPLVDACFAFHFISSTRGGITINLESHRYIPKNIHLQYVQNVETFINALF